MALADVDGAGHNDVKPVTNLADPPQGSAGSKRAHLAEPAQAFDFSRLQGWKRLVVTCSDNSGSHSCSRMCAFGVGEVQWDVGGLAPDWLQRYRSAQAAICTSQAAYQGRTRGMGWA